MPRRLHARRQITPITPIRCNSFYRIYHIATYFDGENMQAAATRLRRDRERDAKNAILGASRPA